jgi:hypothetical protein
MRTIIALALLAASSSAIACQFTVDCDVGSTCVKQDGQLDGVCVGGINPGNRGDDDPYKDDMGGTVGMTCSFNTDCDVGEKCVKEGGQIDGVCMKKR